MNNKKNSKIKNQNENQNENQNNNKNELSNGQLRGNEKFNMIEDVKIDDLINLMNVYLNEWVHRDLLLWKQIFTYFYATLFVMLIPHISDLFVNSRLSIIPNTVFYVVGLTMATFFLYISLGYSVRLEAVGKTYQNLISYLPKEIQRYSIRNKEIKFGTFFSIQLSKFISFIMFIVLIFIGAVLIYVEHLN